MEKLYIENLQSIHIRRLELQSFTAYRPLLVGSGVAGSGVAGSGVAVWCG